MVSRYRQWRGRARHPRSFNLLFSYILDRQNEAPSIMALKKLQKGTWSRTNRRRCTSHGRNRRTSHQPEYNGHLEVSDACRYTGRNALWPEWTTFICIAPAPHCATSLPWASQVTLPMRLALSRLQAPQRSGIYTISCTGLDAPRKTKSR